MSENKDNVVEVDFGTTEPNTQEIDAEQLALEQQYIAMFLNVGQSTYEWAMYATREEYIEHMLELYDHLHPEQAQSKSVISVSEKKIILPN